MKNEQDWGFSIGGGTKSDETWVISGEIVGP